MLLRFTLAARLALIAVVGFSAISIVIIAVMYHSRLRETDNARPSPSRLAALAELVELTAPDARGLLLEAVSSPQFTARIEPGAAMTGQAPARGSPETELRNLYAAALAGRQVAVSAPIGNAPNMWLPRLSRMMTNATEIRIALKDGEALVVNASTRLPVTPLGLPVGFGAGMLGTIIGLLALVVMQRETRPLARLAAAVDRVDLFSDPPPLAEARRSAPEIRALIAAFNRLQTRLSEMLRARMTLVGGIAHDVRTFATRLRLRVEQIPDTAERQRAIVDIDDMIRLLDDALLSSSAGAGGLAQEMTEIVALVRADVQDRRTRGDPVDVESDESAEGAIVLGDRLALRRVIGNIIDNAIKYGRAAHVRTALGQKAIVVIVDDDGPGIPAHLRQAMLEPFNRLETSRNRATGGAGLGLAVARSLVEAHGGTIELTDAPGGGARVVVSLPVFQVH